MDINILLHRSGLSANQEEIEILEKDLENILATIKTIPDAENQREQYLHYMVLRPDIVNFATANENDHATKEAILANAKFLQDDMFKI